MVDMIKSTIARLVSEGKTTKEIAQLTGFTVSKIRYYRENKKKYKQAYYRRQRKRRLVELFGHKCQICQYSRYIGNLAFHHLDPTTKEFGIAGDGITHSIDRLIDEAKKCILICHICHGEVHAGIISIPNIDLKKRNILIERSWLREKERRQRYKQNKKHMCDICGKPTNNQKYCSRLCEHKSLERIEWPGNLPLLVEQSSKRAVAKLLGVSDKAVAKRLKNHHSPVAQR